jgi:hypothetical protein
MTPFTAGLCFTLSSMSVTARFFPSSSLPHAVDLPAVLQVGVANVKTLHHSRRLFSLFLTFRATLSSRAPGNSFKPRHCRRSASSSRSIDRSIELCVVSFSVAPHKLSASSLAYFRQWKTCISASTAHSHFTAHPSLPTSVRTCIFFLSSNETSDRHLALT